MELYVIKKYIFLTPTFYIAVWRCREIVICLNFTKTWSILGVVLLTLPREKEFCWNISNVPRLDMTWKLNQRKIIKKEWWKNKVKCGFEEFLSQITIKKQFFLGAISEIWYLDFLNGMFLILICLIDECLHRFKRILSHCITLQLI